MPQLKSQPCYQPSSKLSIFASCALICFHSSLEIASGLILPLICSLRVCSIRSIPLACNALRNRKISISVSISSRNLPVKCCKSHESSRESDSVGVASPSLSGISSSSVGSFSRIFARVSLSNSCQRLVAMILVRSRFPSSSTSSRLAARCHRQSQLTLNP